MYGLGSTTVTTPPDSLMRVCSFWARVKPT